MTDVEPFEPTPAMNAAYTRGAAEPIIGASWGARRRAGLRAVFAMLAEQGSSRYERAVNIDGGAGPTRGTPEDPNRYARRLVVFGPWEPDPDGQAWFDQVGEQIAENMRLIRAAATPPEPSTDEIHADARRLRARLDALNPAEVSTVLAYLVGGAPDVVRRALAYVDDVHERRNRAH